MARVEISFPEPSIFKTTIAVRITDLNYGNHLGNDSLLSILHEARVQFFSSMGYSELDVEGTGIIMADVAIRYMAESHYGDNLTIEIAVGEFTRAGFTIFYRVLNDVKIIAVAKTGIVCFDYAVKKVVSVPEKFLQKIQSQ